MIYLVNQEKNKIICFKVDTDVYIDTENHIKSNEKVLATYNSNSDCMAVMNLLIKKIRLGEDVFEFPNQKYVDNVLNNKLQ